MPRHGLISAVAGIWLAGSSLAGGGTADRFIVERFGSEQGLPQSSVLAITQTRDGYLWVGTLDGLARFDGRRFTRFDRDNTPGLKSNSIGKLFEDSQGNLWIGGEREGIALVSTNGDLVNLTVGPGSSQGQLRAICEDRTGAVWLLVADTSANGSPARLARFYHGSMVSWPRRPTRQLIAEDSGLLWADTDGLQGSWRPGPPGLAAGPPEHVDQIGVGRLDFLLASRRGGYWRLADFHISRWSTNWFQSKLTAYPWDSLKRPVFAVCEDLQGNLVAGTWGTSTNGAEVYWFDAQMRATRIGQEEGLPRSAVLSLYVDREGCLWVGTNGDGLTRLKRAAFEVLPLSATHVVQSVCDDGQGGLWIAYNEERLDHWTSQATNHYTSIVPQPHLSVYLSSVLADRDHRVWVGTKSQGLFQLRDREGDFVRAPGAEDLNPHINALFQDRRGVLWIGTDGGLDRWDGKEWKRYTATDGLPANAVKAIADDADGNLWAGTAGGGLVCLREGHFTAFTRTDGLPSDDVTSLLVEKEGGLWVGTTGGVARFRNGQWSAITRSEGLLISHLGYLAEDHEGYLWVGSNGGLVRLPMKILNQFADQLLRKATASNPAEGPSDPLKLRTYGTQDGLPTVECSFYGPQPVPCQTPDGRLWFPTVRGLVSVDPAELRPNTNPPPVVIESVSLQGRQGTNSLRAAPPQEVDIPAGQGGLDIRYTSLNLAAADRARFSYWMEGHEPDWSPPGEDRHAYYGKLPPGRYQFHVTACNEDGVWNREGRTLAVVVLPPLWQKWWFLTGSGLLLLGAIVGSVHYVSTQKLQRQVAVLRQHEALEAERARIARDLHDQLGANLTQVALLGELAETDRDLPAEVGAHARQISQTARDTTRALDEIVWTVNPANDTLDGLVNYLCKYAQEYLAVAGLRYRLEVPADLPVLPISPELRHNVFLVAKEALNNVVKHAHAASAHLRLHLEPGRFTLEIEDDGQGLPPGAADKGRNGLRNMRKRMEDIGGVFRIGPGHERGTLACISAPVENRN